MIQYLTQSVSFLVGKSADIPVPRFLRPLVYEIVTKSLKINPSEATIPLLEFPSVQALFTRKLKPGARPIPEGAGLLSPCDGTLRSFGTVENGACLLVKDRPLAVADLLASEHEAVSYLQGTYFNFYLSPKDYHRIHTSIDGTITAIRRIPGTLLPVADWSIARWPRLFAQNERVVFDIENQGNKYATIMVGALNVGGIKETVSVGQKVSAGDELGVFELGSSVVILSAQKLQPLGEQNRSVKVHEEIASR